MSTFLPTVEFLGLTDHSRIIAGAPTDWPLLSYLAWIGAVERAHLWR